VASPGHYAPGEQDIPVSASRTVVPAPAARPPRPPGRPWEWRCYRA